MNFEVSLFEVKCRSDLLWITICTETDLYFIRKKDLFYLSFSPKKDKGIVEVEKESLLTSRPVVNSTQTKVKFRTSPLYWSLTMGRRVEVPNASSTRHLQSDVFRS